MVEQVRNADVFRIPSCRIQITDIDGGFITMIPDPSPGR